MVTAVNKTTKNRGASLRLASRVRFNYVTAKRGRDLLDRQARRYLGMSGAQFKAAYRAGTIPDPDRSDVIRVAMLLPFADD